MTDPRLRHLQDQIASIHACAAQLAAQAEDLHAMAYERSVVEKANVSGGAGPRGVECHGDERAQELFHRLERAAETSRLQCRVFELAVERCLGGAWDGQTSPVR